MKIEFVNNKITKKGITKDTAYPYITTIDIGGGTYLVIDYDTVIYLGNKSTGDTFIEKRNLKAAHFWNTEWYLYENTVTLSN